MSTRSAVVLLALGYLWVGIAHIAFLPPWEGNDEAGHYSYLQQVADTLSIPRQDSARLSEDVEHYFTIAPAPYDYPGGITYKTFFRQPAEKRSLAKNIIHNRPELPRHYTDGVGYQHEAQHPPLYYVILSPVYLATAHWSLGSQLFLLRLFSYLFAWLALIIGLYANAKIKCTAFGSYPEKSALFPIMGVAVWPILFPAWFPEFARIGNDSLCALLMSLIWLTTIIIINGKLSFTLSIILGILLGLGCLTKVFYLPVAFGLLSFLCLHRWKYARFKSKGTYCNLSIIFMLIFAIAGWWYFMNWYQFGVITGSDEFIGLDQRGGLLRNLWDKFTFTAWVRGHAAMVTTFAWSCTESWARPPYVFLAPMSFTVIALALTYLSALRGFPALAVEWLPVWIALPLVLGLSYHVLVSLAIRGEGRGTGGYYLHFLVAPLGFALSLSLFTWWVKAGLRRLLAGMVAYALLLTLAVSWLQVLMFAGLVEKSPATKFYQLSGPLPFPLGLFEALSRLEEIAFPYFGLAAGISGGLLALIGLAGLWTQAGAYARKESGVRGTDSIEKKWP